MSDTTTATKPRKKPGPKAGAKKKGDRPAKKAGRAATPAGTPPAAPEAMPLTALDLTVAKAVRAGTDAEAVERYKARYAAKEAMPPLECTGTRGRPDTPVWVGDGGHRALALLEAGKTTADCLVWWFDTPEEAEAKAWEIAYAGNTTHGLPRTSEDLRAAIRSALLREPPATSDRAIAEKLHCHRVPIVKVRVQMTEAGELTGKAGAEGRYKDSEYAQWVTGKGKRPEAKAAPEPMAARPPEVEAGWRGVSLGDVELDVKVDGYLLGKGVNTIGTLSDALDDAANTLPKLGERELDDLRQIVEAVKADGLVTADTPVPLPVDPVAATPAAVERDEKGRPVPDRLAPVFQARRQFRSLSQRVGSLLAEIEALAGSPGGAAIQVQSAKQDAHSLSRGVAGGMPYVVCPACSGDGTAKGGKACPHCVGVSGEAVGRGWVCRLRYDQFEPGEKRKAEGPWEPSATPEPVQ